MPGSKAASVDLDIFLPSILIEVGDPTGILLILGRGTLSNQQGVPFWKAPVLNNCFISQLF